MLNFIYQYIILFLNFLETNLIPRLFFFFFKNTNFTEKKIIKIFKKKKEKISNYSFIRNLNFYLNGFDENRNHIMDIQIQKNLLNKIKVNKIFNFGCSFPLVPMALKNKKFINYDINKKIIKFGKRFLKETQFTDKLSMVKKTKAFYSGKSLMYFEYKDDILKLFNYIKRNKIKYIVLYEYFNFNKFNSNEYFYYNHNYQKLLPKNYVIVYKRNFVKVNRIALIAEYN